LILDLSVPSSDVKMDGDATCIRRVENSDGQHAAEFRTRLNEHASRRFDAFQSD
jgi:hypothetical protein